MAHYEDLTPYEYGAGCGPALNVGWLDDGGSFPTGDVPPAFVLRLELLSEYGSTEQTRGLHPCPFCPAPGEDERVPAGSAEVRAIAANGTRYAAPTLVSHYVAVHGYRPPQEFIDAVMRVAGLCWEDCLRDDRCFACGASLERVQDFRTFYDLRCDTCGVDYRRWVPTSSPIGS